MIKLRGMGRTQTLQLLAAFLLGVMVSSVHRLLLQQPSSSTCRCPTDNHVAGSQRIRGHLHLEDHQPPANVTSEDLTHPDTVIRPLSHPTTLEEAWLDEQSRRRDFVKQVCERHLDLSALPLRDALPRDIRVNERHKVVYCAIPKVACTTWKGIFMALHLNKTVQEVGRLRINIHNRTLLDTNDLVSIRHYSDRDIQRIFSTYTKMMVVRHPYDRLVSAYTDKILRVDEERNVRYFRPFASRMLRRYHTGLSETALATGVGVTLEEFLRYITDTSIPSHRRIEDHWTPYLDLCLPCAIRYDYILKLETIQDDTEQVLRKVFNSPMPLRNLNPSSKDHENKGKELEKLDVNVLRSVYRQYAMDMDMFGYEWPDQYKL